MRTTANAVAVYLLLASAHLANAGVGQGVDLKSPWFAGDPDLEDCFDDMARLTMTESKGPAGRRLVSRGRAVAKVKDALIALNFTTNVKLKYDLGVRGDPNHPDYDLYDHAMWKAIMAFKRNYSLGAYDWGDVGPG